MHIRQTAYTKRQIHAYGLGIGFGSCSAAPKGLFIGAHPCRQSILLDLRPRLVNQIRKRGQCHKLAVGEQFSPPVKPVGMARSTSQTRRGFSGKEGVSALFRNLRCFIGKGCSNLFLVWGNVDAATLAFCHNCHEHRAHLTRLAHSLDVRRSNCAARKETTEVGFACLCTFICLGDLFGRATMPDAEIDRLGLPIDKWLNPGRLPGFGAQEKA